jgi:hypothetical protein
MEGLLAPQAKAPGAFARSNCFATQLFNSRIKKEGAAPQGKPQGGAFNINITWPFKIIQVKININKLTLLYSIKPKNISTSRVY